MKTIAILTLAALTGVASAASIFSPGDPIAGGQLNGGTFNARDLDNLLVERRECIDETLRYHPFLHVPSKLIWRSINPNNDHGQYTMID